MVLNHATPAPLAVNKPSRFTGVLIITQKLATESANVTAKKNADITLPPKSILLR